jgi:aldose 1-epimerase
MHQLPAISSFTQELGGKPVTLVHLKNSKGWQAALTNYGARLVSLLIPDKKGDLINVVAGFDSLEGYLNSTELYYGVTVGRYANRIANAKFSIEGTEFTLDTENPSYCLHGGPRGFHVQVWSIASQTENEVVFTYFSPDKEMGFPGNLQVKVTYTLTDDALCIRYHATTDQPTVCNLTHHSFFNLNGEGPIVNQKLAIHADYYLPLNQNLLPTGQRASVVDTPFDFTKAHTIGEKIEQDHPQLKIAGGYDHNYILNKDPEKPSAIAVGDISGIKMELYTDKPGLQLYTSNFTSGKNLLSNGKMDLPRTSFCLEPQYFPNSPNEPDFPSALLLPLQQYESHTKLKFSLALL